MTGKLQQYFPMLRSREAVFAEIQSNDELKIMFKRWPEEAQEEFLDFCCGNRGVKMLYDFVFKEVMNPEYTPERLDEFLSLLLGQQVHIVEVLPNDGTRIADESSLLIMDIVVELETGGSLIWKYRKSVICFRANEVRVIRRIFCYVSTRGCEVRERKNSRIKI